MTSRMWKIAAYPAIFTSIVASLLRNMCLRLRLSVCSTAPTPRPLIVRSRNWWIQGTPQNAFLCRLLHSLKDLETLCEFCLGHILHRNVESHFSWNICISLKYEHVALHASWYLRYFLKLVGLGMRRLHRDRALARFCICGTCVCACLSFHTDFYLWTEYLWRWIKQKNSRTLKRIFNAFYGEYLHCNFQSYGQVTVHRRPRSLTPLRRTMERTSRRRNTSTSTISLTKMCKTTFRFLYMQLMEVAALKIRASPHKQQVHMSSSLLSKGNNIFWMDYWSLQ